MGDINLDWARWTFNDYSLKSLLDLVKVFMADTAISQTVRSPTRYGLVEGQPTWSTIDNCYTTNSDLFTTPATH